ncbi:hypothetical protein ACS0TY_007233 [Phlomoides rotata]
MGMIHGKNGINLLQSHRTVRLWFSIQEMKNFLQIGAYAGCVWVKQLLLYMMQWDVVDLKPDWSKAHLREAVAWYLLKRYLMSSDTFKRAFGMAPKNEQIERSGR